MNVGAADFDNCRIPDYSYHLGRYYQDISELTADLCESIARNRVTRQWIRKIINDINTGKITLSNEADDIFCDILLNSFFIHENRAIIQSVVDNQKRSEEFEIFEVFFCNYCSFLKRLQDDHWEFMIRNGLLSPHKTSKNYPEG